MNWNRGRSTVGVSQEEVAAPSSGYLESDLFENADEFFSGDPKARGHEATRIRCTPMNSSDSGGVPCSSMHNEITSCTRSISTSRDRVRTPTQSGQCFEVMRTAYRGNADSNSKLCGHFDGFVVKKDKKRCRSRYYCLTQVVTILSPPPGVRPKRQQNCKAVTGTNLLNPAPEFGVEAAPTPRPTESYTIKRATHA